MPAKVYGLPAVEVEQPGGELVPYRVQATPAVPPEWRAWFVYPPSPPKDAPADWPGYRVSEYPSGGWACDCPASTVGKNRGGRWQAVEVRGIERPVCKHCRAVWLDLGVGRADDAP